MTMKKFFFLQQPHLLWRLAATMTATWSETVVQ